MSNNDLIQVPSLDVLMNRGIGTKLNVLRQDESGRWVRATDAEGKPITETVYIRFTNWTIAMMEQEPPFGFGGTEQWQEAFNNAHTLTLAKTLALIEEKFIIDSAGNELPDRQYGAMRLVDNSTNYYAVVFLNAFMIAQGIPPEKALAALQRTKQSLQERMDKAMQELDEPLNDAADVDNIQTNLSASPSSSASTQDGQKSNETTTSSGV